MTEQEYILLKESTYRASVILGQYREFNRLPLADRLTNDKVINSLLHSYTNEAELQDQLGTPLSGVAYDQLYIGCGGDHL